MNSHSSINAEIKELADRLKKGDRRALAKSITLVESKRLEDEKSAAALTNIALSSAGGAIRIGLSGAPGVGKSTFIEAFGMWLIDQGLSVAVLAVDPSSRRSGGSILGDKTRMVKLAQSPNAFIRPSPAGTTLGGVTRRTRESMILVEAAGFDVVLVETVGVGQSETAVADMVDMFIVLISPSGGDELQGMKRGIMELADLAIVTKADGEMRPAAIRTAAEYGAALHFMKPKFEGWSAPVALVSSPSGQGISEIWDQVLKFKALLTSTSLWQRQRRSQQTAWLWSELREGLLAMLTEIPEIRAELAELEKKVAAGELTPPVAASAILARAFAKS